MLAGKDWKDFQSCFGGLFHCWAQRLSYNWMDPISTSYCEKIKKDRIKSVVPWSWVKYSTSLFRLRCFQALLRASGQLQQNINTLHYIVEVKAVVPTFPRKVACAIDENNTFKFSRPFFSSEREVPYGAKRVSECLAPYGTYQTWMGERLEWNPLPKESWSAVGYWYCITSWGNDPMLALDPHCTTCCQSICYIPQGTPVLADASL
jgi:hypothetical protein